MAKLSFLDAIEARYPNLAPEILDDVVNYMPVLIGRTFQFRTAHEAHGESARNTRYFWR